MALKIIKFNLLRQYLQHPRWKYRCREKCIFPLVLPSERCIHSAGEVTANAGKQNQPSSIDKPSTGNQPSKEWPANHHYGCKRTAIGRWQESQESKNYQKPSFNFDPVCEMAKIYLRLSQPSRRVALRYRPWWTKTWGFEVSWKPHHGLASTPSLLAHLPKTPISKMQLTSAAFDLRWRQWHCIWISSMKGENSGDGDVENITDITRDATK